jgi:hypothetical protein
MIISFFFLFACSCKKEIEIGTDITFVEEQFPKIEDIEEVRYYYNVKSNEREIGLQDIEFCGFIKIGEDFYEKITQEYDWKETKKSRKKVPKAILTEGEDEEYHFSYNYDFSYDGNYKTNSWGGDFYLDKEKRILYFECDW